VGSTDVDDKDLLRSFGHGCDHYGGRITNKAEAGRLRSRLPILRTAN